MGLIQTVASTSGSVMSTSDVKAHCRIDSTADDTYIAGLIDVAVKWYEDETWRQLGQATFALTMDRFPATGPLRLPRPPLQSVSSITYVPSSGGAALTWSSTAYDVSTRGEVGLVQPAYGVAWPTARQQPDSVTITYVAGSTAAAAIPAIDRHGVKLLVGQLYEHREPVIVGAVAAELPLTVQRIIDGRKVQDTRVLDSL